MLDKTFQSARVFPKHIKIVKRANSRKIPKDMTGIFLAIRLVES
jgi:hypothetical protein